MHWSSVQTACWQWSQQVKTVIDKFIARGSLNVKAHKCDHDPEVMTDFLTFIASAVPD